MGWCRPWLRRKSCFAGDAVPKSVQPRVLAILDRSEAHAAGRGVNQDARARAERPGEEHHVVGRQVHDRQGSGFLERHRLGNPEDLLVRDHERVRVTAEHRHPDHAIAGTVVGDALADLVDRARHFVADDAGDLGGVRVQADPGHQVGEVDARRAHADANLTGARDRVRGLEHSKDFRGAPARDPDLPHRPLAYPRGAPRSRAPVRWGRPRRSRPSTLALPRGVAAARR